MSHIARIPPKLIAGVAVLLTVAAIAAACGGSSAKSASQTTSTTATSEPSGDSGRTPGARGFNRTPPPAIQTSIAQGTPPPAFGNRTPTGAIATAIAQGTPASALRGFRGGGAILGDLASILAIDATELRTELRAPSASIERVAAAHGIDRATIRQKLIDAVRQRLNAAVAAGTSTQQMADDQVTQFESNIDRTLDEVGGAPGVFDSATPAP